MSLEPLSAQSKVSEQSKHSYVLTTFQVPLHEIPYIDHPELKLDEHESTQMPFRYMKNEKGKPLMPNVSIRNLNPTISEKLSQGMLELIQKDSEKGIDDLF